MLFNKYRISFLLTLLVNVIYAQQTKIDYSNEDNWSALPNKKDYADLVPGDKLKDKQENAPVDVFFIYPTSFHDKIENDNWNAKIDDHKVNEETDTRSIKYQASLFNQVGKIYAPRYRQANISAYNAPKDISKRAFDFAYEDVVDAFNYYIENFNHGRPFIIASHSQGSNHSMRLVKDYIQGTALEKQMVVAYIVGMPVPKDLLSIPSCDSPSQTGCVCSWRTFLTGYQPEYIDSEVDMIVTNPVTWAAHSGESLKKEHKGSVLLGFEKGPKSGLLSAEVKGNVLWVTKPDITGKIFLMRKNYHLGDYNLFYIDIQDNANLRVKSFLEKRSD